MTQGPTGAPSPDEIAQYVERVRAALADLEPRLRDELLEDLPGHLAEVAAESAGPTRQEGGSPWAALGPPERYAAELRATLDLGTGDRQPFPERIGAALSDARARLSVLDRKVGTIIGYGAASEFLRLLRPGWWVLRGYLAAMAVVYFIDRSSSIGLLPRLGGSTIAGVAILAAAVIGSIWVGGRAGGLSRWPRWMLYGGSTLMVLFAIAGFAHADQSTRGNNYYPVGNGNTDPYSNVRDVYVYDENGKPLHGVYLVDQDGNPISIGWSGYCAAGAAAQANTYPRCPNDGPSMVPDTVLRPAPTGSQSSPSQAPSLSSSPSVATSPSSSPSPSR
jgi:hypothetical protein